MKKSPIGFFLKPLIFMAILVAAAICSDRARADESIRFYCDNSGVNPVTRIRTPEGNIPVIEWKTSYFGPQYPPSGRCSQVSARFNKFKREGKLNYMTTGYINNYPVICVADNVGGSCYDDSDLLLTLRPDQDDPNTVLEQLLDVRDFGGAPLQHYREQVVYEENGRIYVDIDELVSVRRRQLKRKRNPLW